MVFFFARYAPGDSAHREAAVLAASMLAWAIALAVQILVSLVCLRSELAQGLKRCPGAGAVRRLVSARGGARR
jgi:hypothetical protein